MPQKFASDKPTIEEIRRLKKPNEITVPILLDPEVGHRIQEKQQEVVRLEQEAKRPRNRNLADTSLRDKEQAEEELETLMREADDHTAFFVFRDIGRKKYDALVGDHRPTDEQKTEYKEQGGNGVLAYNPETFPPALISATAISPEISLEMAEEICEDWSEGDIEALFFGALRACKERASIPLSKKGTEVTQISPSDSTTPPNGESPGESS